MPQMDSELIQGLVPVSIWNMLVHVGGVVSMGAGAVSFTYIVKASEPAVSAVLSAALLHSFLPMSVYLSLVPVMGGVVLASLSELTFSWKSFQYAMLSHVATVMRGIAGQKTLQQNTSSSQQETKQMGAMNTYAILTILSTALLLPVAVLLEHNVWKSAFESLRQSQQLVAYVRQTILASLFHYTYNEAAFLCLDKVSPVSHALASTFKYIFIISSSILVFGNQITPRGMVGSTIAIFGVLVYSLAKTRGIRALSAGG